jgi:hypothetical protein
MRHLKDKLHAQDKGSLFVITFILIHLAKALLAAASLLIAIHVLAIISCTQKNRVIFLHFLKGYLIEFNTCRLNPTTGFQLIDNLLDNYEIMIKNIAYIKYCCNGHRALNPDPDQYILI